jgi:polysaccharide biosynthesis protein PslH
MLSGAFPLPANNGAKRRILATAMHLSQKNRVTLVSFQEQNASIFDEGQELCNDCPWQNYIVNLPYKPKWKTAIKAGFSSNSFGMTKYLDDEFRSVIKHCLNEAHFDAVWFHTFNMVPYFRQCLAYYARKPQKPLYVLDQHNVDEMYFASFINHRNRLISTYAWFEVFKTRYLQKLWYPRFDVIFSVAPEDVIVSLRYSGKKTQVWLAPNAVNIEYFQPVDLRLSLESAPIVVFGASLDVIMNQDAVEWFVENIWPIVRKKFSDAQFWIVGRNPPLHIQSLNHQDGITVTGTVADVRQYYKQADVFVVPLRFGGGTKLKTLEGMAMGLPVVSTSVGVQGLNIEHNRHVLVSDEPGEFAAHILDLLSNRPKAYEVGMNARRLVENEYDWKYIVEKMNYQLGDLYDHKKISNVYNLNAEVEISKNTIS